MPSDQIAILELERRTRDLDEQVTTLRSWLVTISAVAVAVTVAGAITAGLLFKAQIDTRVLRADIDRLRSGDSRFDRIVLGQSGDQTVTMDKTGIAVRDSAGRMRICLEHIEGSTSIRVLDSAERLRVAIGTNFLETKATGGQEITSESAVVCFDKAGIVLWRTPTR